MTWCGMLSIALRLPGCHRLWQVLVVLQYLLNLCLPCCDRPWQVLDDGGQLIQIRHFNYFRYLDRCLEKGGKGY